MSTILTTDTPRLYMRPIFFPGKGTVIGTNGDPDQEDRRREEDEFKLNVGRAMDVLSRDVPLMFSAAPRLDIFTNDVVFKVSWDYELIEVWLQFQCITCHALYLLCASVTRTMTRSRSAAMVITFNSERGHQEVCWLHKSGRTLNHAPSHVNSHYGEQDTRIFQAQGLVFPSIWCCEAYYVLASQTQVLLNVLHSYVVMIVKRSSNRIGHVSRNVAAGVKVRWMHLVIKPHLDNRNHTRRLKQ